MKIWGRHTSINVQKVLWTCDELSIAYDRSNVGGNFGGLDTPDYRRMNPNCRIPVIEDDGFVLWESNTIVRYLADRYGHGTLYPASSQERADAERWMDWQLCHILPGLVTMFFGLIRTLEKDRDLISIEQARIRTEEFWQILDAHLAKRDYIIGSTFTMGDIPVGTFAYRWFALPITRPTLPNLQAWYRRLCARPAYQKNVMLPLQ
jgi:glutathione S-transferase